MLGFKKIMPKEEAVLGEVGISYETFCKLDSNAQSALCAEYNVARPQEFDVLVLGSSAPALMVPKSRVKHKTLKPSIFKKR